MKHSHAMRLDPKTREEARRRLLTVKGHVDGILKMFEDESLYCVDALKQLKAVGGALEKVGAVVLRSHLKDHVVTAHARGDEERIVEELMELLKYT
jgi:DNA-binding FrmR family transcriptional regulator